MPKLKQSRLGKLPLKKALNDIGNIKTNFSNNIEENSVDIVIDYLEHAENKNKE